ncbi:MAG: hypothetical protein ACI91R_001951 [Vicingaceae bacterium]|jgi:hypothetical protein
MKRTLLQKPSGEPLAWLDLYSNGKRQICRPCGTPLGFYLPQSNTTHYLDGGLVGYGDLLSSLL